MDHKAGDEEHILTKESDPRINPTGHPKPPDEVLLPPESVHPKGRKPGLQKPPNLPVNPVPAPSQTKNLQKVGALYLE